MFTIFWIERGKDEAVIGIASQLINQNLIEKHGRLGQANTKWKYEFKANKMKKYHSLVNVIDYEY